MTQQGFFRRLLEDNSGATAVEYGLIVSLIVIAMMASMNTVANATIEMWANVTAQSNAAINKTN